MIPIAKPIMGVDEIDAVMRVLSSGQLAAGEEVERFEERWAALQTRKYAITVTSGTTALEAAIAILKRDSRDEIIVPAMSFNATSSAVHVNGYKPVFVDIDPDTHTIDPKSVRAMMSDQVRAIIPVHLYGLMADMDALNEIASEWGVDIIEDAAQAHDSLWNEKRPGSWSRSIAQCYSFYATKNLTTGGEGGAITTDFEWARDKIKLLREHGATEKYYHKSVGHNWRMTELQAAIGNAQLDNFAFRQALRRDNARLLTWGITGLWGPGPNRSNNILPPFIPGHAQHGWHQYVVVLPHSMNRDIVVSTLLEAGIGAGIHYPIADSEQPVNHASRGAWNHEARSLSNNALSLPIGPWVTLDDVGKIVDALGSLPVNDPVYSWGSF